eukprot:1157417-Pelagomonas_calceolata.AAC.4
MLMCTPGLAACIKKSFPNQQDSFGSPTRLTGRLPYAPMAWVSPAMRYLGPCTSPTRRPCKYLWLGGGGGLPSLCVWHCVICYGDSFAWLEIRVPSVGNALLYFVWTAVLLFRLLGLECCAMASRLNNRRKEQEQPPTL